MKNGTINKEYNMKLKDIMVKGEKTTPILERTWKNMPNELKKVMGKEDVIVAISARAAKIKEKENNLIRAESGQIYGVIPELEKYYTPPIGIPELRHLIAEFWSKLYNLKNISYENVAITIGASQGLSLIIGMLGYKQKIVLNTPYWPNTPDIITRMGGEYIKFEFLDNKGNLRLVELAKLIKKEKANILFINFPNNPSGIALNAQQMQKLADFAKKHNLVIISDEVYNRIRFNGKPLTMLSFAPERSVAVCSASKEYLVPGARVGYVISASPTITNVFLNQLVRIDCSCVSILGQSIILPILKKELEELRKGISPTFLPPVLQELQKRRDAIANALLESGFKITCNRVPDGSIFIFAKIPEKIKTSDTKFVEKALEMEKLSGIPGSECGKQGWLRFCFGYTKLKDIEIFRKNLNDVVKALN